MSVVQRAEELVFHDVARYHGCCEVWAVSWARAPAHHGGFTRVRTGERQHVVRTGALTKGLCGSFRLGVSLLGRGTVPE